jgi:hypothetical protein
VFFIVAKTIYENNSVGSKDHRILTLEEVAAATSSYVSGAMLKKKEGIK